MGDKNADNERARSEIRGCACARIPTQAVCSFGHCHRTPAGPPGRRARHGPPSSGHVLEIRVTQSLGRGGALVRVELEQDHKKLGALARVPLAHVLLVQQALLQNTSHQTNALTGGLQMVTTTTNNNNNM